jgi:hypothetical protein
MFIDYGQLKYLYSRQAISKLSGLPKKTYKQGLVAMFVTSLISGNTQFKRREFLDNMELCQDILGNPKIFRNEENEKEAKDMVQSSLEKVYVKNPSESTTMDDIIKLMRKAIEEKVKGNRYLVKYEDLDELIDVKLFFEKIYKNPNPNISPHHWLEFDIEMGLAQTFPEFLTYAHLVSLWNIYVDKNMTLKEEMIHQRDNIKIRTVHSEIHALHTSLWVQAVTFVESYLYYVFFNVNKGDYTLNSEKARNFIKVSKPDDNQIINSLIISEFSNGDNRNHIAKIKRLHKQYKNINDVRNRFIHASAFEDNENSHLLPLISSNSSELIKALELCIELVLEIENVLPSDLKILFWWDRVDHPNYKDYIKGNFIKREDIILYPHRGNQ